MVCSGPRPVGYLEPEQAVPVQSSWWVPGERTALAPLE